MNKWILLAALASPLVLAGCSEHRQYYGPQASMVDDVRQRGYHDGFEAARRDAGERRRPDMDDHRNFRNPPVPGRAAEDYRHAFRAGYNDFMHHGGRRDGDRRSDGAYR